MQSIAFLDELPLDILLAALFLLVAVGSAWRGTRLLLKGLLMFGVVFLGEELYETWRVLLALREGQKASGGNPSRG